MIWSAVTCHLFSIALCFRVGLMPTKRAVTQRDLFASWWADTVILRAADLAKRLNRSRGNYNVNTGRCDGST